MRILGYEIDVILTLVIINVIIFFVSFFNFDYFVRNYSLIPAEVSKHPWTIITSMFLHGGFDHIIFNMISLYFFGLYLGSIIGEKELLKVYFAGGILGGLFFVISAIPLGIIQPYTPAIGASGAIFALGAALAILRPRMVVFMFPIPFPMPLYIAVFGIMFLMSFIIPNTAWQGHIGGLLVGIIFGYWYKRKQPLSGHLFGSYDQYRY